MTRVCTSFADRLGVINPYIRDSGWTENELSALQSQIAEFKTICQTVYAGYKASDMESQNEHLLDHIAEGIKHLGDV